MKNLLRLCRLTLLLILVVFMGSYGTVQAITFNDLGAIQQDTAYYDPTSECNPNAGPTTASGGLDRLLQTFAFQESGGNPQSKVNSSTSDASGKYGFLASSWKSIGAKYYPPSQQWTEAYLAPEEVQDAVMYIWKANDLKTFEGDLFKVAVNHFLPAALTNDSLMDTIPRGNVHTPREYGEIFLQRMESGEGSSIPIKYSQAPDFQKYVDEFGITASDTASTGGSSTGNKQVIVLDPGHSGSTIDRTDPTTGLHDGDYNNTPEMQTVFDVAQFAKTQLESIGYTVILTKNSVNDSVYLRDRAEIANNANAALAISIHTQGDRAFGTWQEIYTQKVGLYRGSGERKVAFTDNNVAQKSQQYASAMKEARDAIEVTSGTTEIKDNSFDGRAPIEPGNIPMVQLFARVPWLYLEAGGGASNEGLNQEQKAKYAEAIVEGVKRAAPTADGTDDSGCTSKGSQGNGSAVDTALLYAWHEYKGKPYTQARPEYTEAINRAVANGQYVGGISLRGIDCGGFVTRVMIDSGFEPGYNYGGNIKNGACNTLCQQQWMEDNWQKVGSVTSTSQLQPGDVAINPDHTFMYVGEQPDFETTIASSSLDSRAPMAGKENPIDSSYTWYRKK